MKVHVKLHIILFLHMKVLANDYVKVHLEGYLEPWLFLVYISHGLYIEGHHLLRMAQVVT